MRFRPCIDIHNGSVKQIVGSSLSDAGDFARENFVASKNAAAYALRFRQDELRGGHIVILNGKASPFYEASLAQVKEALAAFPDAFSVGGGITPENANDFLEAGASDVIVTSYLFENGRLSMEKTEALAKAVGPGRLILDLSCAPFDGAYHVMCDRWQSRSETLLSPELLHRLAPYCHEFLIHAVAAEGKMRGPDQALLKLLAAFSERQITYAGGIRSLADIALIRAKGRGAIDFTVGSALDLYGGPLPYADVLAACKADDAGL